MNERTRLRKTGLQRCGSMFSASLLIAALAGTLSCGGDGSTAPTPPPPPPPPPPPAPPAMVGTMPAQTLEAGASVTVDASGYFRDPNGDALTYAAASSDGRVVEATVSGSQVTVAGIGPGTATVTVTATDPGGLSGTQGFGVVVSGSVEDDFDSPASLNEWATANAEATVADGALNLTNQTQGRLGIAERREMPAVSGWTIMARMGRTARKASPGVVSLTRHGRFTAVRLVLRTLDDDDDRDRDRAADTATGTRNYEFAVFDGSAGEWVLVTNLSGGSGSVFETPGEFTDLTLGHEGGDFVAYAGETGSTEELFRFDLATSEVDGVGLGEIVSDVTGVWLVNQAEPGLTAQHDRVRITGTGSDATPPDAGGIAEAPDAATRSVSVSGPDADRAALVALYEATDGPNWVNSENWLTDAPIGDWYGVETNQSARVVALNLSPVRASDGQLVSNGLTGLLPPELGNLTSLEELDLFKNNLTGEIPPELGNLASLKDLSLRLNQLTGPIPPELGKLSQLEWLDLGSNNLEGVIPRELGNLPNLEMLRLWGNRLTGAIPSELGDLASLTYLQLDGNELTGQIPSELGRLSNLEWLALHENNLTGEIPAELGALSRLEILYLFDNGLSGEIPPELGGLASLTGLLLRSNQLTGAIPSELGNLVSLRTLNFSDNELTGQIPPELGNLSSLTGLALHRTGLTGRIPPELGRLANLTHLQLDGNDLSGDIPPELGDLASLTDLYLFNNRLTGPLPESLLRLSLSWFWWHNNAGLCAPDTDAYRAWLAEIEHHVPGPFCSGASDREALVTLYEATDGPNWMNSENWLTDAPLDDWYGVETNGEGRVVRVVLEGNGLEGDIPAELSLLGNLTFLSLGGNGLTGPIPPELGNLASLEQLWIFETALEGRIPSELGELASLKWLVLSGNRLMGSIPSELGNLGRLEQLYLSDNELTGAIPSELSSLGRLELLDLSRNELTGAIPSELGSLDLRVLWLHNNKLTGSIPAELGGLDSLVLLRVDGNDLAGSVPPEFGDLANLGELTLSDNNLTGQLPESLLNLSLRAFWWNDNEGLCSPDTTAFRTWLAMIEYHRPGPFCSGDGELIAPQTFVHWDVTVPLTTWRPGRLLRERYHSDSGGWSRVVIPFGSRHELMDAREKGTRRER